MAKRSKQRRVPIKTGRVSHRFELDIRKAVENELDKEIQQLVADRKFASTIRNALRLVISLNAGDLDVLGELYPHVVQRLSSGDVIIQPPLPMPDSQPNKPNSDTSKEIEELRKSNEQLRQMIKDLTDLVASMRREGSYIMSSDAPTQPMQPITGKQLGLGKMLAAPTFEDDDLLEFTASKSTIDVSENLVRNMFGLQR